MTVDKTWKFRSEDEEMNAAIENAKRTFGQFLDAFFAPGPGQKSFLVKVAFVEGDDVEHIWVADLEFTKSGTQGVVANESNIKNLKFMQTVTFDPCQITDWMYIDNGQLVGGYTTRLIRKRMTPSQRRASDAVRRYTIEDDT